ncbi:MAG: TPM domain-containing protein [Campylobacteraceae bacterium]|nr:TPM domain-containing protein [Campylobacteraceae bacterium]
MTAAFLFFIPFLLQAKDYVISNENNIIGQKTAEQINEIGEELYEKDGINAYVFLAGNTGNISAEEHIDLIAQKLESPYVLLVMFSEDKIIDIISSSKEIENKFDKTQILSPFPTYGTIKPLLSVKRDADKFSAAILNGYIDIAVQIAKSDNKKLEKAPDNSANKIVLRSIELIIFAILAAAIFIYTYRKVKYHHAKKEK